MAVQARFLKKLDEFFGTKPEGKRERKRFRACMPFNFKLACKARFSRPAAREVSNIGPDCDLKKIS